MPVDSAVADQCSSLEVIKGILFYSILFDSKHFFLLVQCSALFANVTVVKDILVSFPSQ